MTRGTRNATPAPETAVAVFDPAAAGAELQQSVERRKPQLAALLSIDPETERGKAMLDRFVTVALHAATSNPDLLRCTTESLVESIRQSAILGLEPTGALGDGALVVYNVKVKEEVPSRSGNGMIVVERSVPTAQFQPMYRGLLKLARRSDQVAVIDAAVVYEGDGFEIDLGLRPRIVHQPATDGTKRGGYLGAYAFARLRNGEEIVEWMTLADLEAVRKTSRAKDNGPWVAFWSEMARKTVLRRLMKRLPLESAAEHAVRLETEAESVAVRVEEVASRESAQTAAEPRARLLARLGVPTPDEEAPPPDPAASVDPSASAHTHRPIVSDTCEECTRMARGDTAGAADDVEEGVVRDVFCGAGSDPELGEVETCVLPPGHLDDPKAPKRHQAGSGAVWPATKETK